MDSGQTSSPPKGRRTLPPRIARDLHAARLASGISLTDLAAAVGITRRYLARLQAGERCPSVTVAGHLCWALDLDAASGLGADLMAYAVEDRGHDHPKHRTETDPMEGVDLRATTS